MRMKERKNERVEESVSQNFSVERVEIEREKSGRTGLKIIKYRGFGEKTTEEKD